MGNNARSLLKNRGITGSWEAADCINALSELEKIDSDAEKNEKKAFTRAALCLFGIIASLITGAMTTTPYFFYLAPVFGIALVIFVLVGIRYSFRDLDDGFRVYLFPLLRALSDDIKKNKKISIEMDFFPTDKKIFKKSKSDKYQKGVYHKCYDTLYERDYLKMTLPLHDGNRLVVSVRDSLIEAQMTKKNPRGKIKTKRKYKKQVMTYTIRLKVSAKKYRCKKELIETNLKDNIKKVDIKQTMKGPVLVIVGVVKSKREKKFPDTITTLKLIGRLYSCIEPVTNN
ncbi:hypothetical protein QUF76_04520 [Desulfobacterales bacterium HSG16]|nr:hypothetical protein [Desulfobacterales bacterium HSG16]